MPSFLVIHRSLSSQVEDDLQHIHDASNQEELVHFYKQYGKNIIDLSQHAQRRQQVASLTARASLSHTLVGLGRSTRARESRCCTWHDQACIDDAAHYLESVPSPSGITLCTRESRFRLQSTTQCRWSHLLHYARTACTT